MISANFFANIELTLFSNIKDRLDETDEQSKFVAESLDNDADKAAKTDLETSVNEIQKANVKSKDTDPEELLLELLLSFDEANKNGNGNDKAGNILYFTDADINKFATSLGLDATKDNTIINALKTLVKDLQEEEAMTGNYRTNQDEINTKNGTTSDEEQIIINDIKTFNNIKGSSFGITDAHIEAYAKHIGIDDDEITALKELVNERKNERFGNLLKDKTDTYIDIDDKKDTTTEEEKRLIDNIKVFSGLDADSSILNLTDEQVQAYAEDLGLNDTEKAALLEIVQTYKDDIKGGTKAILTKKEVTDTGKDGKNDMTDAEKENVIAHLVSTSDTATGKNVFYLEDKDIKEFVEKELNIQDKSSPKANEQQEAIDKLTALVEERKQEKRDEVAELLEKIEENPGDEESKAAEARLEELIKDDIRIRTCKEPNKDKDITQDDVSAFVKQWGFAETESRKNQINEALNTATETATSDIE